MKIEMNGITLDVSPAPIDGVWMEVAHGALQSTVPSESKKDFVLCMYASGLWNSLRLTWSAAITKLSNGLALKAQDDRNREYLKIVEIWWWMKCSGKHDLAIAMLNDLGYEVRRKPKIERLTAIAERIDKSLAEIRELTQQAQLMRHENDDANPAANDAAQRVIESAQGMRFSRAAVADAAGAF